MTRHRAQAYQGLIGLLLIAVCWPLAWLQLRPYSNYYFFPLWLGYILTLDGLIQLRTGTSLWRRGRRRFLLLFVVSAPFWWSFEWLNQYVQNWHYLEPHPVSRLWFAVEATVNFSTVIPAVLETTELLASLRVGERLPRFPAWRPGFTATVVLEGLGWLLLVAIITLPRYFFPASWVALFLIVEPLNVAVGQRSVFWFLERRQWAAIWNLMLGALATGVFWESWNFFAMPKWYYTVPFVDFLHIWEMPLLGYGGYLPFGLEVFAVFGLGFWLVERQPQRYARVSAEARVAEHLELPQRELVGGPRR